jgi:hypothetical protein
MNRTLLIFSATLLSVIAVVFYILKADGKVAPPGDYADTPFFGYSGEAFPERRVLWDRPANLCDDVTLGCSVSEAAKFEQAEERGRRSAESIYRILRAIDAWLEITDDSTGFLPRNVNTPAWVIKDSQADNYPWLYVAARLFGQDSVINRLERMHFSEIERANSFDDRLPRDLNFHDKSDTGSAPGGLDEVLFAASEYLKDGLLSIIESGQGKDIHFSRLRDLSSLVIEHSNVQTPFGRIPTNNPEVHGNLLIVCSRLHLLDVPDTSRWQVCAEGLARYYVEVQPHLIDTGFSLSDHSHEILLGLIEFCVHVKCDARLKLYIDEIIDFIIVQGTNSDGLFCSDRVSRVSSTRLQAKCELSDNFGYILSALYAYGVKTNQPRYRDYYKNVFFNLSAYSNYHWEGGSADGLADALEGVFYILPFADFESEMQVTSWITSTAQQIFSKQHRIGFFEGWHGDGNVVRTLSMYALWNSQGVRFIPFDEGVQLGAQRGEGGGLYLTVISNAAINGRLIFDSIQRKTAIGRVQEVPLINSFPVFFSVEEEKCYQLSVKGSDDDRFMYGKQLINGLEVTVAGTLLMTISPVHASTCEVSK